MATRWPTDEVGNLRTLGIDDFDDFSAREIMDELEESNRTATDFESNRFLRNTFGDSAVNRIQQQRTPPLAYDPLTTSIASSFGYGSSPLNTPPHLRNISSTEVGLSSPPVRVVQPHRPRVIAYKGTPPTGTLRSSPELTSLRTPPHSIGEAGVGLASPTTPRPRTSTPVVRRRRRVQQQQQQQQRQRILRLRRRVRPPPPVTGARGTATSSARTRVNRVRNTPRTQQTVQIYNVKPMRQQEKDASRQSRKRERLQPPTKEPINDHK